MGNRQNLPHSQLTENKPKSQNQPPSEKVISHFYRKKFARPAFAAHRQVDKMSTPPNWLVSFSDLWRSGRRAADAVLACHRRVVEVRAQL
jgi:hypothetical protein